MNEFALDTPSKILLKYWSSLPREKGGICPRFADVDMDALAEIKENLLIDERHNDEVICVVFSGRELTKTLGLDVTGQNVLQLFSDEELVLERQYFKQLHSQPCAGLITRFTTDLRGLPIKYRTSHLPLLGLDGTIRFWIGIGIELEIDGQKGDTSQINLANVQLVERTFFDIGAGVPETAAGSPSLCHRIIPTNGTPG